MIPSHTSMRFLIAFSGVAICGSTSPLEDYAVRKGQTVSFIAFRTYGAYDDSIIAILKADNPRIPDLDRVVVGQILHLRTGETAPVAMEKDPKRRIQMASRRAVVTLVQGTGEIRRTKGGREPLAANRFLTTGDTLLTGADGFAEIIIDNQSVLRMASGTEVLLTAIQEPRRPTGAEIRAFSTRFSLLRGKTWTKVRKWAGAMIAFQVKMPNAIAGVQGTVFENSIAPDSSSSVSVYQGKVDVRGGIDSAVRKSLAPTPVPGPGEISATRWIHILKEGQRLDISKFGTAGPVAKFQPDPASEWVKLNQERDSLCD